MITCPGAAAVSGAADLAIRRLRLMTRLRDFLNYDRKRSQACAKRSCASVADKLHQIHCPIRNEDGAKTVNIGPMNSGNPHLMRAIVADLALAEKALS